MDIPARKLADLASSLLTEVSPTCELRPGTWRVTQSRICTGGQVQKASRIHLETLRAPRVPNDDPRVSQAKFGRSRRIAIFVATGSFSIPRKTLNDATGGKKIQEVDRKYWRRR